MSIHETKASSKYVDEGKERRMEVRILKWISNAKVSEGRLKQWPDICKDNLVTVVVYSHDFRSLDITCTDNVCKGGLIIYIAE